MTTHYHTNFGYIQLSGLKGQDCSAHGFSIEGKLISASAVPHCGVGVRAPPPEEVLLNKKKKKEKKEEKIVSRRHNRNKVEQKQPIT